MSCVTMELQENENPTTVNKLGSKIDIEFTQVEEEEVTYQASSEQPSSQNNRKIDDLFYGICYFSFFLGVNFYRDRSYNLRCFSLFIVTLICSLELYFTGYIAYLTLTKPFDAGRVATSISVGTWVLQATLSTLFLAWWQHTSQPCKVLRLLYEANEGLGVYHYRKNLSKIVNSFYFVMAVTVFYYAVIIVTHLLDIKYGYMDDDIPKFFGDRRLFIFVQLTSVYCIVNWVVAIFIFSLLVYATSYEFVCFNDQVRSIKCDTDFESDEAECDYILKLIKTHNRLRECVNHLDHMFHRYAFVMIATIIPTTIFTLFVMLRLSKDNWISQELLLSSPFIFFCVFSFFALVNSPSQLHNTIYSTKSALCANTNIWFPYRANVYHAALAFVCHLDQTHLGVSIWGFAVVSKKLVLTTISVMVTCLALFLEVGDCSTDRRPPPP